MKNDFIFQVTQRRKKPKLGRIQNPNTDKLVTKKIDETRTLPKQLEGQCRDVIQFFYFS